MWRSSKVVGTFYSSVEVVIVYKKKDIYFKFCTFIRHYSISSFQEFTQLWLWCLHFENGFRQVPDYMLPKNVMNMHVWPKVSRTLPASLSTGKSLGLRHLGGLAALLICPVLSDPGGFSFSQPPLSDEPILIMLYINIHILKRNFICGQFGANN